MLQTASIADLPAFLTAHADDPRMGTGCTVLVAPAGAVCGVDVRGGGPATRETDLLKPENMIESVHAVVLSGGSAFGLASSTGVMEELAERGIGFPVESALVPIVVSACSICSLARTPIRTQPWAAPLQKRRSIGTASHSQRETSAPDAAQR